jgi:holin-like protein
MRLKKPSSDPLWGGPARDTRCMFTPSFNLARLARVLLAGAGLLALQWLGDEVVSRLGWPVPGALVGLLVLLAGLLLRGGVPQALDDVSTPLLRHLMLLLIPSVAAVGASAALLITHGPVFALAAVPVTALTVVATAWTLQRLLKRGRP